MLYQRYNKAVIVYVSYSPNFWHGKTLMNHLIQNFGKGNVGEFAIALILKCLNVYCQNFDESVGESVTFITIYASNISQILYFVQGIITSV